MHNRHIKIVVEIKEKERKKKLGQVDHSTNTNFYVILCYRCFSIVKMKGYTYIYIL